MNRTSPFKVGDGFFRALASSLMIYRRLKNRARYSFPVPSGIVKAKEYAEGHPDVNYLHLAPEQFILEINKGRLFGEGFVITPDNRLISDTSPDFHRHQASHWLLSAGKLPEPKIVNGTVAVLASAGSNNYFHWTLDTVPRIKLLAEKMESVDFFYIFNQSRFHKEWLQWLGIPENKILPAEKNLHIQAQRIILPSFVGDSGMPSKDALNYVRGFMPPGDSHAAKKIFISRAHSPRRKIIHEERLYPTLQDLGFKIYHPGKMNVKEQMTLFASASHVIAPHGAELTNLVYCHPQTKVLEIFSPAYINPCYRNIAVTLQLDYSCMVGKEISCLRENSDPHHVWANIHLKEKTFRHELNKFIR